MIKTCKDILAINPVSINSGVYWIYNTSNKKIDGSLDGPESTILIPLLDECEAVAGIKVYNSNNLTGKPLTYNSNNGDFMLDGTTTIIKTRPETTSSIYSTVGDWTVNKLVQYVLTTQNPYYLRGDARSNAPSINHPEIINKLNALITAGLSGDNPVYYLTSAGANWFANSGAVKGSIKFDIVDVRNITINVDKK